MDGAVHDPPPLVRLALGVAVVVVLLGLTVLPFLTPAWFALAQERAGVARLTGWSPDVVRRVTDRLLGDVVLGPPRFDVAVDGTPVLSERERGHLRDVRAVLVRFGGAVVVAAVVVLVAKWWLTPAAFWAVAERTGIAVAVAVALVGLVAVVAFAPLFELFHRLFFPPGTYTFDPARERLVQLFPMTLWFETAIAAGLVLVALGFLLAALGRRRGTGKGGS